MFRVPPISVPPDRSLLYPVRAPRAVRAVAEVGHQSVQHISVNQRVSSVFRSSFSRLGELVSDGVIGGYVVILEVGQLRGDGCGVLHSFPVLLGGFVLFGRAALTHVVKEDVDC